jgi:hypothetical protein
MCAGVEVWLLQVFNLGTTWGSNIECGLDSFVMQHWNIFITAQKPAIWNAVLYVGMTQPTGPTALQTLQHYTPPYLGHNALGPARLQVKFHIYNHRDHPLQPTHSTYHHRSTRTLFKLTTCIRLHLNNSGWQQATFAEIPICHEFGSTPFCSMYCS